MTAFEIEDIKLLALHGDVYAEMRAARLLSRIKVSADEVEGVPRLFAVSMEVEVLGRLQVDEPDVDAEEERLAMVTATFGVALAVEPAEFDEQVFIGLSRHLWPYLRQRCLALLTELRLPSVRIPLEPSDLTAGHVVPGTGGSDGR